MDALKWLFKTSFLQEMQQLSVNISKINKYVIIQAFGYILEPDKSL